MFSILIDHTHGNMRQDSLRKMLPLSTERRDWRKIFPLGLKIIFAILRQHVHNHPQELKQNVYESPQCIPCIYCLITHAFSLGKMGEHFAPVKYCVAH